LSEPLIWIIAAAAALALAFAAGSGIARRGTQRGLREVEAYLEGWEQGERWAEAQAAKIAARSVFRPLLTKLAGRRRDFLDLGQLSQATSHRLQKLMDVISEEVLIYDPDGRLLFASVEIHELAGLKPSERDESNAAAALASVAQFLESHSGVMACARKWLEGVADPEGCAVNVGSGEKRRRFFATPYLIGDSSAPRMGLVIVLTHMEVLNGMRLNALRKVALEHIRLSSELLAHRVRNPLNSIVLVVELLRRAGARTNQPGLEGNLTTIQEEVTKLEAMLERFVEIMRRREHQAENMDLVAVIETVSELLYPLARESDIRLRQELQLQTASMWGDPLEVTRAVLVPCLAALRASSPGGEIKLRLDHEPREHVLLLEATGLREDTLELGAAEELVQRNRGALLVEATAPGRVIFRFPADGARV
jgi:signal transduction histidine kinase